VWWTRPFSVVALVVVAAWSFVIVGSSPAMAKDGAHGAATPKAFTHPAGTPRATSVCQPAVSNCPVASQLWSGYLVSSFSATYTNVSASWIQTKTTCPMSKDTNNAWSLFWVGLDGRATRTVEQGGSEAQCMKGKVHYYAWWEMYPTNSIQSTFPVHPGDHITSSVMYTAGTDTYTVTVNDTTPAHTHSLVVVATTDAAPVNPDTYTVTQDGVTTGPTSFSQPLCVQSTPCQNSSAEWIVEAPGDNGNAQTLYPLAHFRPVVFQDASATDAVGNIGSISDPVWQYTALNLVNTSSQVVASVSGLKDGGQRFRDTWVRL
jgi:hypothetical protein